MTYQPTPGEQSQLGGGTVNTSLWQAIKDAFPSAILTSAMTDHPDDGGYHPAGKAIDIGNDFQAYANWIYANYPDSAELIYVNGPFLLANKTGRIDPSDQAGIRNAYGAATVAEHADHVHWARETPVNYQGGIAADGAGGTGGISGAGGTVTNAANLTSSIPGLGALIDAFKAFNSFVSIVADGDTWVRLGQMIIGAIVVGLAAWVVMKSHGVSVDITGGITQLASKVK